LHPSSGAHTTVSTASGICHTVTAICRYRGRVGTVLSVVWVAYATHIGIILGAHPVLHISKIRVNTMDNLRRMEEWQTEQIPPITLQQILNAINVIINPKKAPGFDLITGGIWKQLSKKAIVKLTYLYNAAFRLKYVPGNWKPAEVIMIPKPGNPATEGISYRPISLLTILSKLFEKLLLKR
jgi:hypothetical protein